jgi:hypothetical protein
MGDKIIMVLRLQGKQNMSWRKQRNAIKPDALGLGTKS